MSLPFRVALTGGIGSGKSTVTAEFSSLGVPVIDSDLISRELVKSGKPALAIITEVFGQAILTEENELDRKKLREVIFNDDKARIKLEEILHPIIYQEIDSQINAVDYPYCLVVIPLLIETQEMGRFDRILLIEVPENIQIERTAARDGSSPELIKNIIKSQAKAVDRLKYADDIIDNSVEIDELKTIVKELHMSYLKISNNNK